MDHMAVSKTSAKETEPRTVKYVADLYGDVEYMCGSVVNLVRNALVRQGADRGSAMRPDIYNGVVSWVNPDGSPASFVSSGGGAALVTVRACVIRRAGYPALPWGRLGGYTTRRARIESDDAPVTAARDNVFKAAAALKNADFTCGGKQSPPPEAISLAERAAAAVICWNDANMMSYERWSSLSDDFPGICAVLAGPGEWSHISDALDIEGAGKLSDPAERAWTPGADPDFISDLRWRIKRVSDLAGRDIMAETAGTVKAGGKGSGKTKRQ